MANWFTPRQARVDAPAAPEIARLQQAVDAHHQITDKVVEEIRQTSTTAERQVALASEALDLIQKAKR